ncbi:MAG TPA: hypothetical protein VGL60_02310, partial [Acidimicrobiales bacterium]
MTGVAAQPAASGPEEAERILFAPRPIPPLGPDAAQDPERYRRWLDEHRRARLADPPQDPAVDGPTPAVTFLLLVTPSQLRGLVGAVRNLRAQSSPHWSLTVGLLGGRRTAGVIGGTARMVTKVLPAPLRSGISVVELAPGTPPAQAYGELLRTV